MEKDSKAIFSLIGEEGRDRLLMSAADTGGGGGGTNSAILGLGYLKLTPELRQLLPAWPPRLQWLPSITLSCMLFQDQAGTALVSNNHLWLFVYFWHSAQKPSLTIRLT